jgi:hypothetical protein
MRHSLFVLLALLDADLIRAALRHADISITKAALWMEMDRTLLERQLDGEGHLSHKRLLMLPLKFHQWFSFLSTERYGQPQVVKRGIPIVLALAAHRRMLRITQITRRQLAARKETA